MQGRWTTRAALALALGVACGLAILIVAGYARLAIGLAVVLLAIFAIVGLSLVARQRLRRGGWAVAAVAVVVSAVGLAGFLIPQMAQSMLFHPNQDVAASTRLAADPKMQQVSVEGGYTGWFVHNVDGKAPLVIYFGGNGECASHTISGYDESGWWDMYSGANFMMVDYPGYGSSGGHPSQTSMYAMALAVYDYAAARSDVDASRIVISGYSIGTGPATYVASQRPVAGLILIAPYKNAISLYNGQLNIFHGPLTLLVTQHFDSDEYAPGVKVAPLMISSRNDETINYTQAQALAKVFPQTPQLHVMDGLRHNDYFTSPDVRNLLRAYVQEAIA